MSAIKVEGIPGWDGTYELSEGDRAFTAHEWRLIKQHSGWLRGNIEEGFAGEDPDLFLIVAVIAMVRSGKVPQDSALKVAAQMSEMPYNDAMITLVPDPGKEDDALPPASESENGESSRTDSLSNNDTKTPNENLSGMSSSQSSERLGVPQ